MADTRYDVLGIGNAVVDVLTRADDSFIEEHGLNKGAMTLIDAATAETLYATMTDPMERAGGSVANSIAALAELGSRAAFIGKVCDDTLGESFRHSVRDIGVAYDTPPSRDAAPTARCLIFVTPDAQRTMQTYLGASTELGPRDIDAEAVAAARVTYLEGYLWDPPEAKEAFLRAAKIAEEAGNEVALSLSDPFCVDRHRADFLKLLEGYVDILFANEEEICSLYEVEGFDDALQYVRGHCEIAVLTRSERGAVIVAGDEVHVLDAAPVKSVVDTTGAGDAYAAGFLYGYTRGFDLASAGRAGAIAAAEVIGHMGARPETSLEELVGADLRAAGA